MGYHTTFGGSMDVILLEDMTAALLPDELVNKINGLEDEDPEDSPEHWNVWSAHNYVQRRGETIVPTSSYIEWDCSEKSYSYEMWLQYILEKILIPAGYGLQGCFEWQGEDQDDMGRLITDKTASKIHVEYATRQYHREALNA